VKTRRYTEVQVFRILQEVDSGTPVIDAARLRRNAKIVGSTYFTGLMSALLLSSYLPEVHTAS